MWKDRDVIEEPLSPNFRDSLLQRLRTRSARIGVVGMGYVGLPLALRFAEVGYPVLGFDIDSAKVEALNAGRTYIGYISAESISAARENGFEASADFSRAASAERMLVSMR